MMTSNLRRLASQVSWLCLVVLPLSACLDALEPKQPSTDTRTLGEEIYHELCNRVARGEDPAELSGLKYRGACLLGEALPESSGPRLGALAGERERFIKAVDDSLIDPIPNDINDFLRAITPLYDDEGLQAQTRALAALLKRIEDSPEALAALNRLGAREGYRPLELTTGLARPLLGYERIDEVIEALLNAVGEDGGARAEWQQLLLALQSTLANASTEDTTSVHPSNAELMRDLMLSESNAFSDGSLRYLVRRDARGVAELNGESAAAWRGSFADTNFDGLPDIGEDGAYVDAQGVAVQVDAPFALAGDAGASSRDTYQRLLADDGSLVFDYVETSSTLLSGALQETRLIWENKPEALIDLIYPLQNLLGPSEQIIEEFEDGTVLPFNGFNTAESPILDVAYAASSFADQPALFFDLRLVEELLVNRESEIASVVSGFLMVQDWLDEVPYSDIQLKPGTPLGDEVIDYLEELASVPGLLEDFLGALDDPRSKPLPGIMAGYMRYTDAVEAFVDSDGDINGPAVTRSPNGDNFDFNYGAPVDRNQPDNIDNRSIFQRFVHLTADVHKAPFCNKAGAKMTLGPLSYPLWGDGYDECELFEIEDMATFYVQVILGTGEMEFKDGLVDTLSNIDFMLESLSGVDGFTKFPTFQAVNRVMFTEPNDFLAGMIDPPRALDGGVLKDRHPGTIFSWEQPGFVEGIKPIAEVLGAYGREDLFGELLTLVHRHWYSDQSDMIQTSEPNAPLYVYGTGLVQFEEIAARGLTEANLMNAGAELVGSSVDLPVDQYTGRDVITDTIRQMVLPEWNEGLTTRSGEFTVLRGDGQLHPNVTPARLFVDALRKVDDAFQLEVEDEETFSDAMRVVTDVILPVSEGTGGASFDNRRALEALKVTTAFARARVEAHWNADDIVAWAASMPADVEELLKDPVFYSLVKLLDQMVMMPETRAELEDALGYLIGQVSPNEAFSVTLVSLADGLQMSVDDTNLIPLLHALAPAFNPDGGLLDAALQFVSDANALDDTKVTTRLLERLVAIRPPTSETAFEALVDIAGEVNRQTPGAGGRWSADDYAGVMAVVREYLLDDDYGVERLYQLIENR